jgi:heme/copper-type cytochrome/quinol oxidase subunit 2
MKFTSILYWFFVAVGITSLLLKERTTIAVICLGLAQAIDNYSQPKPWKERTLLSKIWTTILFMLVFCLIGLEVAIQFK